MSLIRDSLKKVQENEETLDQTTVAVAAEPKTGGGTKSRQSVYVLLGVGLLVMAAVYFMFFQASPQRPAQPPLAGGGQGQPGAAAVPGPATADSAKASPAGTSATTPTVTAQAAGSAVAGPASLATIPPSKPPALGSEGAGAIPPAKAGASPQALKEKEQATTRETAGSAPPAELRKEKAGGGAEPRSAATATPSALPGRGIEIDTRAREDLKKAYAQAYSLQQEGKWDLAQARYREILAQDPYNPYVLTNLGLLYQKTGRLKEAVSNYEKALEADPRFVPALQNLGVAWIRLGNGEEAARWLERSLALDPDNSVALANLGTVYNKKGNRELARQYWKRSLDLDPRVPEVNYNLARLEEEAGNFTESYRYYQQFIRLRNDPSDRLVLDVQRHIREWKVPGTVQ